MLASIRNPLGNGIVTNVKRTWGSESKGRCKFIMVVLMNYRGFALGCLLFFWAIGRKAYGVLRFIVGHWTSNVILLGYSFLIH